MYVSVVKLKALKRAPIFIAVGVIGLVCLAQVIRPEFLERLERQTYDLRVQEAARHSPAVATNLGFVYIGDETIKHVSEGLVDDSYGLYWPRQIYGRVARELKNEGAKATAFDILFGELRPDHPPVPVLGASNGMDSDLYFAEQMKAAGNVILAAKEGVVPPQLFRDNAAALGDITAEADSDGVLRRARAFRIYRKWHPAFQQAEDDPDFGIDLRQALVEPRKIILPRKNLEPITIPLDENGNFDLAAFVGDKIPAGMARHAKPFTEERVWHMGIVLAAQVLKLDLTNAQVELEQGRITLRGPNGLERIIPVDRQGYFYINWLITANSEQLMREPFEGLLAKYQVRLPGNTNELAHRLADQWSGNDWSGRLVVIGSSASGNDLTDRGATPLQENATQAGEQNTLLVGEHWNVVNSLLTNQFVRRSPLPVELLLIVVMGVLAAGLTWIFRSHIATLWVLVALAIYWLAAFYIYVRFRYWMPLVLPEAGGMLVTHVSLLSYLIIFEQKEQRRVKSVFSRVVSPAVVNELLKAEKLSLSGARRNVTVYFADIRGFTEMTDLNRDKAAEYIEEKKLTDDAAEAIFDEQARETLATVNLYLKVIAETVLKHHGTIDKFIGDCVMAFWGAPTPNEQHALNCVRAAIDVQRAVHRLNQEREAENARREAENPKLAAAGQAPLPMLPVLSIGTGINTGVVTVGLMGSDEQGNYTVFGRDVNLASRLETVSGRGRIIISESTLAEMIQEDPDLALSCVELPPVNVKGIRTAVRIYEVPWREKAPGAAAAVSTTAAGGHDTERIS